MAILAALAIGGCVRPPAASTGVARAGQAVALVGVQVLDVESESLTPGQTVVFQGDRVLTVGPSRRVRLPPGAHVVHADGAVVLPGLWDMHTHALGSTDPAVLARTFAMFLAHGVTGIRDMGTLPDTLRVIRRWLRTTEVLTPRIVASGPVIDGPRHPWSQRVAVHVTAESQVSPLLDSLQQAGSDFFKVYSTLSRATYFAIAAEAKRRNVTFAGHIPQSVTLSEALAAGQRTFEHLGVDTFIECVTDGRLRLRRALTVWADSGYGAWYRERLAMQADRDSTRCGPLVRKLAGRTDAWVTPTAVLEIQDHAAPSAEASAFLAPNALGACSATLTSIFAVPDSLRRRFVRGYLDDIKALHGAGVRLLAGTDLGNPCIVPGASMHRELELLVEAGLPPIEAIRTATSNAAAALGLMTRGGVTAGSQADLLIIGGDPRSDITRLRDVRGVVTAGRYLGPHQLDSLRRSAKRP